MGFELRQNPSDLEIVNEFMKRMKSAERGKREFSCD